MTWAYRAVFTQTNAGGGNVNARFIFSEKAIIKYITIGPDNYGADRSIQVRLTDGSTFTGILMPVTTTDNETLTAPVNTSVEDAGQQLEKEILIAGSLYEIQVFGASLALNETMTVVISGLIKTTKPIVSITGSSGTVTITTTYNKVV